MSDSTSQRARHCTTHFRCDCTAERLAALEAEQARLRAALARITARLELHHQGHVSPYQLGGTWHRCATCEELDEARQALAAESNPERSP